MRLISSYCDTQKPLLPVLLSLLPNVILKSPKSIRLFLWVIFLHNDFLIFLINICLSMSHSFIVPAMAPSLFQPWPLYCSSHRFFIAPFIVLAKGAYKGKAASVVFLILKKTYLPAGLVIICSIGGAVLFASNKTPQVCFFPGEIMTSLSQSFRMSCRWEKFISVFCKMGKSVSNVLQ